jgi:predicted TIM-barrel fold metal-dependent hydrolase
MDETLDFAAPFQCPMPDLNTSRPNFKIPAGAIDTHCHIYEPPEIYPYEGKPWYLPPAIGLDGYIRMMSAIGVERGVFVHAAIFKDNAVILDAMSAYPGKFRAVAAISESISDAELERLNTAGVRGFRANLVSGKGVQFDAARRLSRRVKELGWHAEFLIDAEAFPRMDETFADFPTEVVIDHMGRPLVGLGPYAPGFQSLIRLLKAGRAWSKLSAPYRTSKDPKRYLDMIPFGQALVLEAPDRLVWGTDWPHVNMEPGAPMPNDGHLLDLLSMYTDSPEIQKKILVTNPEKLYGFSST